MENKQLRTKMIATIQAIADLYIELAEEAIAAGVDYGDLPITPPDTEGSDTPERPRELVVGAGKLSFRSGPGTQYTRVIGRHYLYRGDTVYPTGKRVSGDRYEWAEIEDGVGRRGWAAAKDYTNNVTYLEEA